MRLKWIGVLSLLLLLMLTGCTSNSEPFEDDFSDPSTGWTGESHETFARGYVEGDYSFQIAPPHWFVWTTGGRRYTDVALDTQVRAENSPNNHYGLLCRYQNGRFYYFAISADGYYAIFRHEIDGRLIPLTGQAMLKSPVIRRNESNQMTAVCKGTDLSLYVNGELIATVQDTELSRGDIGMAAGTLEEGNTKVFFESISAEKP